jgi:hypothetical protein
MTFGKSSSQTGYDFACECKNNTGNIGNNYNIVLHLTLQTLNRDEPLKLFDMKKILLEHMILANATLHSSLDFLILTRNLPVRDGIELDYMFDVLLKQLIKQDDEYH